MPHDPSTARAGSLASFGVAAAYFASGLCAALMPPELQGRPDVSPHEFWTVLSQQPGAHLAFHWAWVVVAGFCGLAAVPAISLRVWDANRGLVLWSGGAAWLGFAMLARSHLMEVAFGRKVIPCCVGRRSRRRSCGDSKRLSREEESRSSVTGRGSRAAGQPPPAP